MIFALKPGMTDFQAFEAARLGGLPLGCHATFATGNAPGLCGPTGKHLALGEPISLNICHWGANICRAGWLARSADDLPSMVQDYADLFVAPYVAAMSDWCGLMRPGVSGSEVWARMRKALPFEFMLNALRLREGFNLQDFADRTGLPQSAIAKALGEAQAKGLIERNVNHVQPTARGFDLLSDLQALFL